MRGRHIFFVAAIIAITTALAAPATADTRPLRITGPSITHHGGSVHTKATRADSLHLIGDPLNPDHLGPGGQPPQVNGTFQDIVGQPDWNGWTSHDVSVQDVSYWQISEFHAPSGQYAYWCGTYFDDDPGYGNDWDQRLRFTHTVADPGTPSTVHWTATMRVDVEPSYDWVYLEVWRGDDWETLQSYSLYAPQIAAVDELIELGGGEYGGPDGDQILLQVRIESDGAWSDEDGYWDTDGALQIDDIAVTVDGVQVDFEDFEDQTSERWIPYIPTGVGDYAQLFCNLQDEDPCVSNFTQQVAFIDDGVVVPGTGGSPGMTWRYGPGGFIVNNTGGPAGPDSYINNVIVSPVVEWPQDLPQALLEFDVYVHEQLEAFQVWPGVFYQWHVRSTSSGDPADLDDEPWDNRHFVHYGGPEYRRHQLVVTDLLAHGVTHAQVQLRVLEYGYVWGWVGTDGTPAPYFDNVHLVATEADGPAIVGSAEAFFEDGFPAAGAFDPDNLAGNSVRLDAARNIASIFDLRNDPGDSCWFDIKAVRPGAVLMEYPQFHVRMRANPLFDGFRTLPAGFNLETQQFPDGWSLVEGWVAADTCFRWYEGQQYSVEDRWVVDLPDTGFFYPGDVMHWYVEAQDWVGGDVGTSILPADTSGYGDFQLRGPYPLDFTVRALPTVETAGGHQPRTLVWLDAAGHGGDRIWLESLYLAGGELGDNMDLYVTNAPSAGVGNGLGGRATAEQLEGYESLFYSCGSLTSNLMANGDFDVDPSDDLGLVTDWLDLGDRNLLIMGDSFVSGTLQQGAAGAALVNDVLGVTLVSHDITELISNQVAPLVELIPGYGIFGDGWIADGGCPTLDQFDAVEVVGGAERLAEFTDLNGNTGVYPYAACVLNSVSGINADVIYLPYDLSHLEATPDWDHYYWNQTRPSVFLNRVAAFFTWYDWWLVIPGVDDTPEASLAVSNHPNPFNPSTTFALRVPRDGPVSLKLYSIRGELVRTLVDERLTGGLHQVTWDGRDGRGRAVASGVYFAETRAAGQVTVNKVALVK